MNIYEKLLEIQSELKCGKTQFNSFGNYKYRNCEDILEAIKPLCKKNKVLIYLSDEIELIGDRFYVKATATAINVEKPEEKIIVTASSREEDTKKGMDQSQITGASSSYARKYALNGLLDIDDTKDSDATNADDDTPKSAVKPAPATVKKPIEKPTAAKPKVLPAIDPTSKLTFGKHKGKTWAEIFVDDESYFEYLISHQENPDQAKRIQALYDKLSSDKKATQENADDFKAIDTEFVNDFEEALIQQRTAQ